MNSAKYQRPLVRDNLLRIKLLKLTSCLFPISVIGVFFAGSLLLTGCGSSESATSKPKTSARESSVSANFDNNSASPRSAEGAPRQPDSSNTQTMAEGLIADDGKTLWARPTKGPPLDLSGIAEGAETVLLMNPKALLVTDEGKRFWRALGPAGEGAQANIQANANQPLNEIKRLVVNLGPGEEYGEPSVTLAIDPTKTDEIPLVRREFELLAESLDDDFHLTFLFSPKFMLGDGGGLFIDQWKPIRDLLTDLAGEDWQAASLSLNLSERFYWELRVVGTAATRELLLARSLGKDSANWPLQFEQLVRSQAWPDYSRTIIHRSPEMMGLLAKYTRYGVERRQTVLNGYLPAAAAHNLALSSELLLAGLGQTNSLTPPAETASVPLQTVTERLKTPISLQFRRESLETALQLLSDATNIPITLGGRDLQLEGITRNQMLGLDLAEKPAGEVLVEILRRANPDTLATGANDERQKLVYILRMPDSDKGSLHITTRSAAKARNENLPSVFIE